MIESFEVWTQFFGAVSWLTRVKRPGLTPTEALEEALRWWIVGVGDPEFTTPPPMPASESDPLQATLLAWLGRRSAMTDPMPAALVLEAALVNWSETMAVEYNDGERWPHPGPARGWPVSAPG